MKVDSYSFNPDHPHHYTRRTFGNFEMQRDIVKRRYRDARALLIEYETPGWWESDIFEITKEQNFVEYECKLGYSDFLADFRKGNGEKHKRLLGGDNGCPNFFWYLTPSGLIPHNKIPSYAGLIEFNQTNGFVWGQPVKPAPLIHSRPYPEHFMCYAFEKMHRRLSRIFVKEAISDYES